MDEWVSHECDVPRGIFLFFSLIPFSTCHIKEELI